MKDIYDLAYELYLEDVNYYKYEKAHEKDFFIAYREHPDYYDYFVEAYKRLYEDRKNKINKLKDNICIQKKSI